jgi:hypothetical protein
MRAARRASAAVVRRRCPAYDSGDSFGGLPYATALQPPWGGGGGAAYVVSQQRRPLVVVVELAHGGTNLLGGGHDGVTCCSDKVLAQCFWLRRSAWKVVEVVLGSVLSSLSEEDGGAPRWSYGGGRGGGTMGLNLHRAKALPDSFRCRQR